MEVNTAADPGFPRLGAPTYYFAKFRRKLHENEENWMGGRGHAPKILLCRSATVIAICGCDACPGLENLTYSMYSSDDPHVDLRGLMWDSSPGTLDLPAKRPYPLGYPFYFYLTSSIFLVYKKYKMSV